MTSLLLLKSMLLANATLQKKQKLRKKNMKLKKMPENKLAVSSTMCRICDQEKGEIPIFNNLLQPNIPENIHHFTGVQIDNSDNFSKHMCHNCLELLHGCILFKEMCQKTNNKLVELAIKKEINEIDSYATANTHEENSDGDRHDDGNVDHYFDFNCSHCGKSCPDLPSLDRHVKKCKSSYLTQQEPVKPEPGCKKKFLCDVCGKTAHSNANLLAHKTIHEPIFPFKCDECPYKGRSMDLLKVHKRSHLTEKPFKCPECSKATTTSSNLAKHMRHVHSSNRPYKCNYCDKAFSFPHDVKKHVKDIHLRQGTAECKLCFKKFNTRKILRGHEWKVHKIKGERQGRLPSYLLCQMEKHNDNHIQKESQPTLITYNFETFETGSEEYTTNEIKNVENKPL